MIRILIIGKRGFVGNNLYKYLKKFYSVTHKSYKDFTKFKTNLNNYNFVINTSINRNYINKKYNIKFDNDIKISNFIDKDKTIFIFLSTRKVYEPKPNLKEKSKLAPKTNYAKNKLITEKKLIKRFSKDLIILRVSNIIGDKSKIKKLHNTFVDVFFHNVRKGYIFNNKNDYKDFISINKFCEIIKNIIKKNLRGTFNVSIGKKIFLNEIVNWLNKFNRKKVKTKKIKLKNDCFYLNNKKLMSKIKIKNSISELRDYCHKISKKKFN